MKNKTITLKVNPRFKWICQQKYGTYTLCIDKPKLVIDDKAKDVGYWYSEGISEDLETGITNVPDWKESLKEI